MCYRLWGNFDIQSSVFLGKKFQGGEPMFREMEEGHRLELKDIIGEIG